MPTQVQFRRGNTAQTAVFTGAVAEITVDTEQKTIVVHDGVTSGGNYLSTKAFTQQVYDYANTIAGGTATDNVARALAQNAYNTANGANGLAQGAYNQANTNSGAITIIQGVDSTQNTRLGSIETINTDQNTSISIIQGVNSTQNTRLGSIETINTDQNTSISIIQGVNSTQNTQIQGLQGVDLATNSAISIIQGVDLGQNTTITAVNQFAQAAYNTANSKFNSSGGTISGDVSVTGNLTVTGETFYANVTNLNVDDSFIVLNANTVGSPVFDAGIEIDRGTANNVLFYWHELTKSWKYSNDLRINANVASESYVLNSIIPVNDFVQSAYNTANGANGLAAGAYNQANTGTGIAQAAFDSSNAVNGYAQSAFSTANGANGLAAGAYNTANGANGLAAGAYNQANTGTGIAQAAFALANTLSSGSSTDNVARALAQSAYDSSNLVNQFAAGAYNTANGANGLAAGAFNKANTNADAITIIQGVNLGQNTTITAINNYAASAYATANNKFNSSGGTISGDVNVTGNLSVTGTTFYANTEQLLVKDNIITLNSNVSGVPTLDAGIEVNRGSETNTVLKWSETDHAWEFTNDGTNFFRIADTGKVNSAFALANTNADAITIIQGVNLGQNTTITAVNGLAAGAFNKANTNADAITIIQGVDLTQNTQIAGIQGVDLAQNASITIIQGVDATQNTRINSIETVNSDQNTAISIIQGVDLAQNTTITAVNNFAAGAFNTANGANGLANGAYAHANSAYSYTTQVEAIALNAYNKANSAFDSSNAVNGFAISAFNKANSANILAQSAYDTANLKFNTSGGNINGDVVITANNDLTVTGNLYVLGNTTSFGTQTLEVVDPMILLATGNYTTDLLDIGFAGSYNDGANAHTGLFRDAAGNKDWYFFEGYTPEVSGNNNINIADASFRTANVNANTFKGNLIATTAVVGGRNILTYTQAAFDTANTANTRANDSVLKSGDTMTGPLIVPAINVGATNIVGVSSNTFTTVSTSQVVIDTFSASVYRSAKYQVQVTSGVNYHVIELSVVHDGTTTYLAQYGEIFTNSSLGTFDTNISGGNVRLLFTGVNAVSTINIFKTTLVI